MFDTGHQLQPYRGTLDSTEAKGSQKAVGDGAKEVLEHTELLVQINPVTHSTTLRQSHKKQ